MTTKTYYYNGIKLRSSKNDYDYALILKRNGKIKCMKMSKSLNTIQAFYNYSTRGIRENNSHLWSEQYYKPEELEIISLKEVK